MRWSCFWALLIYVALDLSLAAMPGAFVFDPDSSIESVDRGRVRPSKVVDLPVRARDSFVLLRRQPARDSGPRRPGSPDALRAPRLVMSCLPRAICAPLPPSEDPH